MTNLVTAQTYKFGQKNIIPYAGEVQISDEGIIEVDDTIAQDIVDSGIGFDFLEGDLPEKILTTTTTTETPITTTTTTVVEETTTTTTSAELGQVPTPGLEGGTIERSLQGEGNNPDTLDKGEVLPPVDELKAALSEKTLAELKELAKDFPSKEWRTLAKDNLVAYLISKL